MIVLDTNIISELMRVNADPGVLGWIASLEPDEVFTTTITQAEILAGLALLPAGRRRDAIASEADRAFARLGPRQILQFDSGAARAYADIIAIRSRVGRPIQPMDAQIAALARSRSATLATRNVKDFSDCGVALINPWH